MIADCGLRIADWRRLNSRGSHVPFASAPNLVPHPNPSPSLNPNPNPSGFDLSEARLGLGVRLGAGAGALRFLCFLLFAFCASAAKLELRDIHGKPHSPLAVATGQRALVFIFVMTDCPIANAFAPEINRITADYAKKPLTLSLVYIEPDLAPEAARKHAKEFGLTATALLDPSHALVKKTGATVTPEAVVLAPDGKVLYRGRIDDRFADLGQRRQKPTTRDLRDALDAVLAGRPVATPFAKAIGCFISNAPSDKPPAKP